MQNPFESGHIKNYILLYTSVVVIMILFFIASTMFYHVEKVEKKVFNTEIQEHNMTKDIIEKSTSNKFKLIDVSY